MAGHILKSLSITNLDTNPVIRNTTGEGGPGQLRMVGDFVTPVSSDDNTSTYRLARFPTNAKVKRVSLTSAILTAGSGDVNVAFSDSVNDGTQSSFNAGLPVQLAGPVDNKLFGAAQSLVLASVITDFTLKGTYTPNMMNIPMWQNLVTLGATQFTTDPGGFFDLFIKITTTITTGGVLYGEVHYVL